MPIVRPRFTELEVATESEGKTLTFQAGSTSWGLDHDLTVAFAPYYAGGPSVFMTEHPGAASDTVFLSALCQLLPKYKMYVAAEVVFGFRGNKRSRPCLSTSEQWDKNH
jgi:hypothetical protein